MATIVTKTVGTSGDYATLNLFHTGEARDLVAADEIARAQMISDMTSTVQFTSSWTTDATRYIWIWADPDDHHNGSRSSGYSINSIDGAIPQAIRTAGSTNRTDLRVSRVRFSSNKTSGTSRSLYLIQGPGEVLVEKCLFHDITTPDSETIYLHTTFSGSFQMVNCGFMNLGHTASRALRMRLNSTTAATIQIYNCTVLNMVGIAIFGDWDNSTNAPSKDVDMRNNLIHVSSGSAITVDDSTDCWNASCDQNILSDASGTTAEIPGTLIESATFQAGTGGSGTRVMFQNVTAGAENLHLVEDDNNAAKDFGNNLSAVSLVLGGSLTDDVDEVGRPAGVWDAGFDELPNLAPTVDAGTDQIVALADGADLDATVTDPDGLPNPPGSVTVLWTQQDGPGTATFDDDDAVDTHVSFDAPGEYVLRLTADDGDETAFDEVTITAEAPLVGALPFNLEPYFLAILGDD